MKSLKLDLGCGNRKQEGFTGVDIHKSANPDVIWDLDNQFPYPFPNDSVNAIRLNEVLEHTYNPKKILKECHRILKKGGSLHIRVPFIYPYHPDRTGHDYFRYTEQALERMLKDFRAVSIYRQSGKFLCVMIMLSPKNIWFARFGKLLDKIFGTEDGHVFSYRVEAIK